MATAREGARTPRPEKGREPRWPGPGPAAGAVLLSDAGLAAYRAGHPRTSLAIGAALVCAGPVPEDALLRTVLERAVAAFPALGGAEGAGGRLRYAPVDAADAAAGHWHRTLDAEAARPLPAAGWDCAVLTGLPDGTGLAGDKFLVGDTGLTGGTGLAGDKCLVGDTGLAGGRFAVLWRGDHVLLDGAGAAAVLAALCSAGDPEGPEDIGPAPFAALRAAPRRVGAGAAGRAVLDLARAGRAVAGPLLARAGSADRLAEVRPDAPPRLRHHFAHTRLDVLRGVGRRHGATVNDVYLAALAGAVRTWAGEGAADGLRAVRVLCPVDIRRPRGGELRNRHLPVRVTLPVDLATPGERLAAVAARTGGMARALRHPVVHGVFRGLPRCLGAWCVERYFHPDRSTLLASNVHGPAHPLRLAGAPVREVLPLNFLPAGHPLSVVLVSLNGRVSVGFTADASLRGAADLPGLWLRELTALTTGRAPGG
ncbi:WS/DGAT domain-containing protein [Streptomyces varsoviensis]|uniref:WS/DGAT domain-containing protein n=1 Tax=Streptomyces varsoviensis TaxID=67373 RepID=UPI0033CDE46B